MQIFQENDRAYPAQVVAAQIRTLLYKHEGCTGFITKSEIEELFCEFWDFAFTTVVYLINRLPTASLNFNIPFTILFNKSPDYKFLRTFGCACFPFLRPYSTYKLDFRSQECVFLGYSSSHKGYKCLSASDKIYISKDVVFNEM